MSLPQFALWRLLGSVTCFALAMGIFRSALLEVRAFGGGLFPAICFIVAISLVVGGAGLLFKRVGEFLFHFWSTIIDFLFWW